MDWQDKPILSFRELMDATHRLRTRTGCHTEACAHAAQLYVGDDDAAIKWLDNQRGKTRFWFKGIVPHSEDGFVWTWKNQPGVSFGYNRINSDD